MREKVAKGLWGREGERGEGKNVGACAWRAARLGGDRRGSVRKRKRCHLCACEEKGGTREIIKCVYMCVRAQGVGVFLSPLPTGIP